MILRHFIDLGLGSDASQRLQGGVRPFSGGKPSGPAQDVVTGFLDANNHARGRPVGLAVDRTGGLLIADDVGDTGWRVSSNNPRSASSN